MTLLKKSGWLVFIIVLLALVSCSMPTSYPSLPMTTRQHLLKELSHLHARSYHVGQTYTVGDTVTINLASDFLFTDNQLTLTPEGLKTLHTIAKLLNTFDTVEVAIHVYTDNQGSSAELKALTQQQAAEIVQVLYGQYGVDTRLMAGIGKGASDPVASNAQPAGRALNRRVVIRFRFRPYTLSYN